MNNPKEQYSKRNVFADWTNYFFLGQRIVNNATWLHCIKKEPSLMLYSVLKMVQMEKFIGFLKASYGLQAI